MPQTIYERLATNPESVTRGEVESEVLKFYEAKYEKGMRELFDALAKGADAHTAALSLDSVCIVADLNRKKEIVIPSTIAIYMERAPQSGSVREFYRQSVAGYADELTTKS